MTRTATRSLYAAVPVPPPPAPAPARGVSAHVESVTPALASSMLDLDEHVRTPAAFARPATTPPSRPRPVPPPASADTEAELRRQRAWAVGVTAGLSVISVATLASWFL